MTKKSTKKTSGEKRVVEILPKTELILATIMRRTGMTESEAVEYAILAVYERRLRGKKNAAERERIDEMMVALSGAGFDRVHTRAQKLAAETGISANEALDLIANS